jgi:hypothetical protein
MPCGFRQLISPAQQPQPQQTVDGLHAALEIGARSSYVPNAPIGVRSRVSGDARPNTALSRLELPAWIPHG